MSSKARNAFPVEEKTEKVVFKFGTISANQYSVQYLKSRVHYHWHHGHSRLLSWYFLKEVLRYNMETLNTLQKIQTSKRYEKNVTKIYVEVAVPTFIKKYIEKNFTKSYFCNQKFLLINFPLCTVPSREKVKTTGNKNSWFVTRHLFFLHDPSCRCHCTSCIKMHYGLKILIFLRNSNL